MMSAGKWQRAHWGRETAGMKLIPILAAAAVAVLPAAALADDARVHTFHCLDACPLGAPENADLIVREIYTLSADPLTKLAVWVAYRITPETIGPSQSRAWEADPWLAPDETLEPEDYDGANAALKVDRGHQAPLAAFSGTPFWPETNILSNITPQTSALNQASWQQLEARETRLAKEANTGVYVLTGPLFERLMPPLPGADERHRVPSGYWKVVMTADGRMSAFLFDQDTPRGADYCAMRRSFDEVELRARLRLLPMRAGPVRSLDGELGCSAIAPLPDAPQTAAK
jgi:endonuclease G